MRGTAGSCSLVRVRVRKRCACMRRTGVNRMVRMCRRRIRHTQTSTVSVDKCEAVKGDLETSKRLRPSHSDVRTHTSTDTETKSASVAGERAWERRRRGHGKALRKRSSFVASGGAVACKIATHRRPGTRLHALYHHAIRATSIAATNAMHDVSQPATFPRHYSSRAPQLLTYHAAPSHIRATASKRQA